MTCEVRGLVYPSDLDEEGVMLDVRPQTCMIEYGTRDGVLYLRQFAKGGAVVLIEVPTVDGEHNPLHGWIDMRYIWGYSIAWFDHQRITVPVLYGPKVPA